MRSRRSSADRDGGWAMLLVLISMLALSGFVAVALGSSGQSQITGRRDQDYTGALQAAQAGVSDYVARLNLNQNYTSLGNSDPSNPALLDPADPARDTKWVSVSGQQAANGEQPYFHYSVISAVNGTVTLRSTGLVRKTRRTISVTLDRSSFLKYVYFTQFETIDPNTSNPPPGVNPCTQERWQGRADSGTCPGIIFRTGDNIQGSLHSVDSIEISGNPQFGGSFTTGWNDPAGKYWIDTTGTSAPVFASPPAFANPSFPSSNLLLAAKADPAQGGTGCLYTGPTRIAFNAGGTMTIQSPFTQSSNPGCGSWPSAGAQTIAVPSGKVIYVNPTPAASVCTTETAAVGFPIATDNAFNHATSRQAWNCRNADVFVEGTLKGQVTVGSANNVIVTGDLTYAGGLTGSDILGLSAQNFVEVYHPITCNDSDWVTNTASRPCSGGGGVEVATTTDPSGGPAFPHTNETVDAAIVASSESFIVNSWDQGSPRGTLNVNGGITQNYRGPVGTSNASGVATGYLKNYVYDPRLLKQYQPPWLASLSATSYDETGFSESQPD